MLTLGAWYESAVDWTPIWHRIVVLAMSVLRLLVARGPSAILWAVVAVVVVTLQCVKRGWTRTHILDEIRVVIPSLTHANATTAIAVVMRLLRVVAAVPHLHPNTVFRRVLNAVMRRPMFSYALLLQTAATLMLTACQIVRVRDRQSSAIAHARPATVASMRGSLCL
jgi:hypothetical protein